jgi:DNA topoisomerase I
VADNLVIVESPAKAKTIERYLGSAYKVLASYGHVRDLPRSDFAIDVHDGGGCNLVYEVPEKSKKHVAALKKAAKDATTVWLAPDLDREGEAIAWHIAEILDLDLDQTNRVTFDEITEPAIRAAFEAPRRLNTALVDAQQARRAVDRIVGYRLSPVLWRTVASGISAGTRAVGGAAADRRPRGRDPRVRAGVLLELRRAVRPPARRDAGDRREAAQRRRAADRHAEGPRGQERGGAGQAARGALRTGGHALADRARGLDYTIAEVRRTEAKRNPKPPFKTSTLQGEASKYGFSARQTMAVAQQLYEGVNLGGEQVGLITYMRTDSLNLSSQALGEIRGLVEERYGSRYTLEKPRVFAGTTKGAQEAHEAIRPTSVARTPERVRRYLSTEQARLYELIWKRTVATQMAPAVFDRISADVTGGDSSGESPSA